jgi:hypothetical protein
VSQVVNADVPQGRLRQQPLEDVGGASALEGWSSIGNTGIRFSAQLPVDRLSTSSVSVEEIVDLLG